MSLETDIQQSVIDSVIHLYKIDASVIGGGVFYFTPNTVEGDSQVTFLSQAWEPFPIQVEGMQRTQVGAPPKPTLSVSNVSKFMQVAVITLGDLRGAEFTRYRTFRKHLADGSDPNDAAFFPVDKYIIEQKTKHNNQIIQWALSSVLDKEGQFLPRRQMLRDKDFPGLSTTRIRA